MPNSSLKLASVEPSFAAAAATGSRLSQWSPQEAKAWWDGLPWLVGCNYIPANAVNQFEMWQAETFDPATIDRELGLAEAIGMNSVRVFLHDQLFANDAAGLVARMGVFLDVAAARKIKPLFVLFDSCWDPDPKAGPQPEPIPGVHNSRWAQSPGVRRLADTAAHAALEDYVKGVVGAFADDARILGWDVWNEPCNDGGGHFEKSPGKRAQVEALLPRAFAWVRSQKPSQPVTSGVWVGADWSPSGVSGIQHIQLSQSDFITFHDYDWPEAFERRIRQLQSWGRPIVCTEYLARSLGSTVDTHLAVAKRHDVGMMNWGLVDGKTQTRLPWDSWHRPYTTQQPPVWFHDLFRADGTPWRLREAELIRQLAEAPRYAVPAGA